MLAVYDANGKNLIGGGTGGWKIYDAQGRILVAMPVNTVSLGAAAAAGTSPYPMRADDTILAFDSVNPASIGNHSTSVPGVSTIASHRDHGHSSPWLWNVLGYASTTSNQTITSTTAPGTDVTSLSVTCTPDGTNNVLIFASIPAWRQATSARAVSIIIQKGGSGVQQAEQWTATGTGSFSTLLKYVDAAPAASSTTYKVSMFSSGSGNLSTNTVDSGTTPTASILVVQVA